MFIHSGSAVPIPALFHSVYLGGPFETCINCEIDLRDEGPPYVITKNFVAQEAIFEMALCLNCLQHMQSQYSQETLKNLQEFTAAKGTGRQEESDPGEALPPEGEGTYTWEDAVRACHLCGRLREECRRYEIAGLLLNDLLLVARRLAGTFPTPMMICSDCQQQLGKLISRKTRDLWDRFIEDHFPGPPGIELDSPTLQPGLF